MTTSTVAKDVKEVKPEEVKPEKPKPKRVSKLKGLGKSLATKTHNAGWLVGALAVIMIFSGDGYFNGWMGVLLGGTMLGVLYVGIEFGMFYCLGEAASAVKLRVWEYSQHDTIRAIVCLVGFVCGAACSYYALITYNAYYDARRGPEYNTVDLMEEKHDFMFWQEVMMFATGNHNNGAQVRKDMTADYDERIKAEREAIEVLGYAPEFALFYQGLELTGDKEKDKPIHKKARDRASSMRSRITILGMLVAIILTFVLITDYTVADEDELQAANDDGDGDEKKDRKDKLRMKHDGTGDNIYEV